MKRNNPLDRYSARRDFEATREPGGKLGKKRGGSPVFVIQKHAARRLHYDFRLEADGVLKSWAIPKGIPRSGEKKLAVMVEDHPLDYQNFEGTIPSGNYGAGTVMIWDKGRYRLKHASKTFSESLEHGELTLVLSGRKVRGEFTLVKFGTEAKNWLLIRKAGEPEMKFEDDLSFASGRTMAEIASSEDDLNLKKVPGARRRSIPEFAKPMLAQLAEKAFDRRGWIFEPKWDGFRIIAVKKGKAVNLYSRNRQVYTGSFSPVAEALGRIPGDFVIDGEVVAVDKSGRSTFELLQEHISNRKGQLLYYVFDILHRGGWDLREVRLKERKKILDKFLPDLPNVRPSGQVETLGKRMLAAALKGGAEGIIGKNGESSYQEGVRSQDWLKIKAVRRQEAVIAGFTEPRGSRKKIGALVLGVYRNGELVFIGHAGGGLSDHSLELLHSKLKPLAREKSPFRDIPKTNASVNWVDPKLVAEVKYAEWTKDGLMRQPVFVGLREDKDPKEVIRESPLSESKKSYSLPSEVAKTVGGRKLILTHLEKIFWPREGYTKGDLIDYYQKVSGFILPYLKDRPESLHRFPDGIAGESFYQKDIENLPRWIKGVKIFSKAESKNVHYMLCQEEAALVYMANLGTIEINPWNSRLRHLDKPDYFVFDIDPETVPFPAAVKVALETKKILDGIGAESFCKTSGKRGLHIYVPAGAAYSHEQARHFVHLVNLIVNRRLPQITSLDRDPQLRRRKVYLDYLQNRVGQTMAAPYSVRPILGAPVSTPLDWAEVGKKLNPGDFTIRTIFRRLRSGGDPWEGMLKKKFDLAKALEKLDQIIKGTGRTITP